MAIPRVNFAKTSAFVDNACKRWGDRAILRRHGIADRYVTATVLNYNAIERMGSLVNPVDRKAIMSPLDPESGAVLSPEPSQDDVLITLVTDDDTGLPIVPLTTDEVLRIVAPPQRVGTARQVVMWRLQVRK